MSSIALIGPGALGCALVAHLARLDEHQIVIAARTAFNALQADTPTGFIVRSPRVVTAPVEVKATVDWVLLATKAYDIPGALPWLDCLCGTKTRIVILQNGVDHMERLPPHFPRNRIVPAIVDCPVERLSPGHVRQRGQAVVTVPDSDAGRACAVLFSGTAVNARVTQDWVTVAWKKLCLNAPGAVNAATLQPNGVVHFPPAANLMRGIIQEVVRVGRAEGAKLDDAIVDEVMATMVGGARDGVNSILADRAAGRKMEVEERNGIVVRLGRKHGIPTPYNEALWALLSAIPPKS